MSFYIEGEWRFNRTLHVLRRTGLFANHLFGSLFLIPRPIVMGVRGCCQRNSELPAPYESRDLKATQGVSRELSFGFPTSVKRNVPRPLRNSRPPVGKSMEVSRPKWMEDNGRQSTEVSKSMEVRNSGRQWQADSGQVEVGVMADGRFGKHRRSGGPAGHIVF